MRPIYQNLIYEKVRFFLTTFFVTILSSEHVNAQNSVSTLSETIAKKNGGIQIITTDVTLHMNNYQPTSAYKNISDLKVTIAYQ